VKSILLAFALTLSLSAQVKFHEQPGQVAVEIDGKPFTTFYFGPDTTKPYFHPLRAASGLVVTRLFPMENVEGESRDHQHHRGLWFSHGNINGINFWENETSYKTTNRGTIVVVGAPKVKGGGSKGTLHANFEWQDPAKKTIIKEERTVTFYNDKDKRVMDLDIALTAVDKLNFVDTKEGTFAIRLADALAEKKTGTMTNAEGASKMKNVWGKPSPWVDYVGEKDGQKVGIAIFDHPANPRHPTRWHARDYGLFAANIFGVRDFTGDKTQDGSMTVEPGKTVRFRYRVLIHAGDMSHDDLAKLYTAYK
jgi:hypothetical protein